MKKLNYSYGDVAALCTSLEYLLHAGISSSGALSLCAQDETRPAYKAALQSMADKADGGASLSEVFRESGCFPAHVSALLAAGESTGRLEESLASLADFGNKREELDNTMKSALTYPAVLLLIMLAVVAALLMYVLPVFNDVYARLGGGLSGLAGFLLNVGGALRGAKILVILVFAALLVLLGLFSVLPEFRGRVMNRIWKQNRENGVAAKLNRARFAEGLSMAFAGGLNSEDALDLAASLTDDKTVEEKCRLAKEYLLNSDSFSDALRKAELLPAAECRILDAGVKGGSSDRAMAQIAGRLSSESETALSESVAAVEPVMVIVSSVLVGIILLSVMLPLLSIMEAIG